jgi:hypothetical protein
LVSQRHRRLSREAAEPEWKRSQTARGRALIAAAVLVIIAVHAAVIHTQLLRAVHHDEGEHLHAAWLMHEGARLYRDFNENHSPYLYLLLQPLVARAGTLPSLLAASRLLMALFSAIAVGCAAALAWRTTRAPAAPIVVAALLLAPGPLWGRAIADVRSEPVTLALFWGGALLLLWSRDAMPATAIRAGLGIGLVAAAALWNPKWPLESLILGVIYLAALVRISRARPWVAMRSIVVAAILPAAMIPMALSRASWTDLRFFSVDFTRAFYAWFAHSRMVQATFGFAGPLQYLPTRFAPWLVAPAALLVAYGLARYPPHPASRQTGYTFLALGVAAALEIRFLYSYPRLWPQYFVMWAFVGTLIYSVALSTVEILRWPRTQLTMIAAATIFFVLSAWPLLRLGPADKAYWARMELLERHLRPGAEVVLDPTAHPIRVRDGSYYWYAFADQVPFAIAYAHTDAGRRFLPSGDETGLPPCAIARGEVRRVQFIQRSIWRNLPAARGCFERALQQGLIHPTIDADILEVVTPSSARLVIRSSSP